MPKLRYTSPGVGFLDTRYLKLTGGTMTGDLCLQDNVNLYFDTAKTYGLKYDSDWAGLIVPPDISSEGELLIYSNIGENASPYIYFGDSGELEVANVSQGNAGSRYFYINFSDGIRLLTSGGSVNALIKADNLTTSSKTFQFPNASGELAVLSDVTNGQSILTNNGATGAITVLDNGNVGIGTVSPDGKLHIDGAGNDVLATIRTSADAKDARLTLEESNDYGMYFEYDGTANIGYMGMGNCVAPDGAWSKRIQMSRSGTEVAFMAGNVGIGYADPGTAALAISGNVGIGVTDPDTKLEVFGSTGLKISFDATDNTTLVTDTNGILTITPSGSGVLIPTTKQLQFNDTSTYFVYSDGDLDLYTAADKTLELQTPVYNELPPTPITAAKLGSTAPTLVTFVDNVEQYTFDATNDYIIGATEVTHGYKEGTDIHPHIHWATNGLEGANKGVKWQLEYTIANYDDATPFAEAFGASVTLVIDTVITANTPDRSHIYSSFPDITGTDVKVGAYIVWKLSRIASATAAPVADPFGLAVGFHIQSDTIGSRQELIK